MNRSVQGLAYFGASSHFCGSLLVALVEIKPIAECHALARGYGQVAGALIEAKPLEIMLAEWVGSEEPVVPNVPPRG